jgi:septal ring factor EnvC (AmiA/AmiB activator)
MPRFTRSSSFSQFVSTTGRISATYHSLRSIFVRRTRQRIHQLETSVMSMQQKLETLLEEQHTMREQLDKYHQDAIVSKDEKASLLRDLNRLKQQLATTPSPTPIKRKRPRLRAIVTDTTIHHTAGTLETVVEDVPTSPSDSDESKSWFALMTTTHGGGRKRSEV